MNDGGQRERVERAFGQQAARFDRPGSTLTSETYLEWAVGLLELPPGALVVDVATGTGLLARALRAQGHRVIGIDVTPAMLERAAARLDLLVVAGAEQLPLRSAALGAVTCRFGLHHMTDPLRVLHEMTRSCRDGGTVGVVELLAPRKPELAARYNHYERLRDPSHVVAHDLDGWRALVQEAGLDLQRVEERDVPVNLRSWLALTATTDTVASRIEAALVEELRGGECTGLRPQWLGGELVFTQTWATLVARKPLRELMLP